jgi:hypothetical protein
MDAEIAFMCAFSGNLCECLCIYTRMIPHFRLHTCAYAYIHIYIHTYTAQDASRRDSFQLHHARTYQLWYVCMCMRMCLCICIYIYIYIYMYIYISICKLSGFPWTLSSVLTCNILFAHTLVAAAALRHTHGCIDADVYMCSYVCVYICLNKNIQYLHTCTVAGGHLPSMHMDAYIHIYTHII